MNLSEQIKDSIVKHLTAESVETGVGLVDSIRLLAKWRALLLQNAMLESGQEVVLSGPVKGLKVLERSAEGCHVPKLLGTYEQPLHNELYRIISEPYDNLLCVGAAEGYYAVGLSRVMPQTKIFAYDSNPKARQSCARLAEINGVLDRLVISETLTHIELQETLPGKTLMICDIEGGERALLDPTKAPALASYDMIVEAHDCFVPGISDLLASRFKKSHSVTKILDYGTRHVTDAPLWFTEMSHLDQLIAVWEWRSGPTPWLIMRTDS